MNISNNDIAHIFTMNNCSKTHIVRLSIYIFCFPCSQYLLTLCFPNILLFISNSLWLYSLLFSLQSFPLLNHLKNNSTRIMIETVLISSRLFACVNVLGSIGVYFLLPETKGIFLFIFKKIYMVNLSNFPIKKIKGNQINA